MKQLYTKILEWLKCNFAINGIFIWGGGLVAKLHVKWMVNSVCITVFVLAFISDINLRGSRYQTDEWINLVEHILNATDNNIQIIINIGRNTGGGTHLINFSWWAGDLNDLRTGMKIETLRGHYLYIDIKIYI